MGYTERKELYKSFEEIRQKPLITYVTSIRDNMSAQMARDAIPPIIEQINKVPKEKKEVDFLIISNGGDPITALRIITILRERFGKISVVLPYVAYSAATILALGADEILMHPYSNLGPVDPQMLIQKPNAFGQREQVQFSSEDIRNYIEFIRSDVGITDQAQLITAFNSLAADVGPINIGSSKRNQQLSLSLSTKMLETHLKDDKTKASSIAQALNISYYHHGYAVGRKEAKEIGLNVIFPEKELEDIMWSIWIDFCVEMKCNQAFDPISEVMNDPKAKQILSQIPVVVLPANTPAHLGDNIIGQIALQNSKTVQQPSIELSLPIAVIESPQMAYVYNNQLNVVYWRDAQMALSFNCTAYSNGWEITQNAGV